MTPRILPPPPRLLSLCCGARPRGGLSGTVETGLYTGFCGLCGTHSCFASGGLYEAPVIERALAQIRTVALRPLDEEFLRPLPRHAQPLDGQPREVRLVRLGHGPNPWLVAALGWLALGGVLLWRGLGQ